MILVTSSPGTKTETAGRTIDSETDVRLTDGPLRGRRKKTRCCTKTDITGIKLLRLIGDLMIGITKTDREIDINKAMDIETDVLKTMLMTRDITTIMETVMMMRRGTEIATMSTLTD